MKVIKGHKGEKLPEHIIESCESIMVSVESPNDGLKMSEAPFSSCYATAGAIKTISPWNKGVTLTLNVKPIQLMDIICAYFDVESEMVKSKSRRWVYRLPRFICMYLMRNELKMPLSKVGEFFNRDHATVLNATRRMDEFLETDAEIFHHMENVRSLVAQSNITK